MKMTATLGVLLLAGAVGWPMVASTQETGGPGRPSLIEPRADEVLRAMSERLAALERFAFEAEETKGILGEAVSMLNDREKIVISLYYYEGMTLNEIGQVLGVTESRASQLHTRAVLQLRGKLAEMAA